MLVSEGPRSGVHINHRQQRNLFQIRCLESGPPEQDDRSRRTRPHMFVWFLTAATARSGASAFAVSTALTPAAAASAVLVHVNSVAAPRPFPPANHMNV